MMNEDPQIGRTTYTYPLGQHKAAWMHASGIQAAGGIVSLSYDDKQGLKITPKFDISEISSHAFFDCEQRYESNKFNGKVTPPNGARNTIVLASTLYLSTCSYQVAPKSTSEVLSLGTVFATLGLIAVDGLIRGEFRSRAEYKMFETAKNIIAANRLPEDRQPI